MTQNTSVSYCRTIGDSRYCFGLPAVPSDPEIAVAIDFRGTNLEITSVEALRELCWTLHDLAEDLEDRAGIKVLLWDRPEPSDLFVDVEYLDGD